jgi:hypothetical protein
VIIGNPDHHENRRGSVVEAPCCRSQQGPEPGKVVLRIIPLKSSANVGQFSEIAAPEIFFTPELRRAHMQLRDHFRVTPPLRPVIAAALARARDGSGAAKPARPLLSFLSTSSARRACVVVEGTPEKPSHPRRQAVMTARKARS